MDIRFNKDADSGLAHCYSQHGVKEREAIEVLLHPDQRFRRKDGVLVVEGQTNAGTYVRVIYREYRDDQYLFVITAYHLTGKAKQAHRRRRRRS